MDTDIRRHSIVQQFAEAASCFCILIDGHATSSGYQFAHQMAEILPEIYRLGLLLPEVQPKTTEALKGTIPSDKRAISRGIGAKFGKLDGYREVFNPYENPDDEPVMGSLSDDFSDIYADLKDGLAAFEASPEEAVWDWKFGFLTHWGGHLVSALRAIHHILSEYLLIDDADGPAGHSS